MTPDGPNIVLLAANGLRPDSLGFMGNPDARTPNLDAIAGHGAVFRRAAVAGGTSASAQLLGLDTADAPLPARLRSAGYQCLAAGEVAAVSAHFDHAWRVAEDYRDWLAGQGKTDRAAAWAAGETVEMPALYQKSFGAQRSNLDESQHVTTWIGDQAVRGLRSPRAPYFLYVNFTKPAAPFDPPAPWDAMYDRDAITPPKDFFAAPAAGLSEARYRKVLAHYYANISHVDQQVGRILATLTARGRTNNVIVFTSDGGDPLAVDALCASKRRPAETEDAKPRADAPVPLVIAGLPGQGRGTVDDDAAMLADVLPTLLDAALIAPGDDTGGTSLMPRLCPQP